MFGKRSRYSVGKRKTKGGEDVSPITFAKMYDYTKPMTASTPGIVQVGSKVTFKADIKGADTIVVKGVLMGNIEAKKIKIMAGGKVIGKLKVALADVYGYAEGQIEITEKILIRSTGFVTGSIRYKAIELAVGGEVEGNLSCTHRRNLPAGHTPATPVPLAEAASTSPEAEPAATSAAPVEPNRGLEKMLNAEKKWNSGKELLRDDSGNNIGEKIYDDNISPLTMDKRLLFEDDVTSTGGLKEEKELAAIREQESIKAAEFEKQRKIMSMEQEELNKKRAKEDEIQRLEAIRILKGRTMEEARSMGVQDQNDEDALWSYDEKRFLCYEIASSAASAARLAAQKLEEQRKTQKEKEIGAKAAEMHAKQAARAKEEDEKKAKAEEAALALQRKAEKEEKEAAKKAKEELRKKQERARIQKIKEEDDSKAALRERHLLAQEAQKREEEALRAKQEEERLAREAEAQRQAEEEAKRLMEEEEAKHAEELKKQQEAEAEELRQWQAAEAEELKQRQAEELARRSGAMKKGGGDGGSSTTADIYSFEDGDNSPKNEEVEREKELRRKASQDQLRELSPSDLLAESEDEQGPADELDVYTITEEPDILSPSWITPKTSGKFFAREDNKPSISSIEEVGLNGQQEEAEENGAGAGSDPAVDVNDVEATVEEADDDSKENKESLPVKKRPSTLADFYGKDSDSDDDDAPELPSSTAAKKGGFNFTNRMANFARSKTSPSPSGSVSSANSAEDEERQDARLAHLKKTSRAKGNTGALGASNARR